MTEMEQDERYPLRGTVLRYDDPLAPVAEEDWAVLQVDEIEAGDDAPAEAE